MGKKAKSRTVEFLAPWKGFREGQKTSVAADVADKWVSAGLVRIIVGRNKMQGASKVKRAKRKKVESPG